MPLDTTEVLRLSRDLRDAAAIMGTDEARFLVDAYYAVQGMRIRNGNQISSMEKSGEPHAMLTYMEGQYRTLENQVKGALDRFSGAHPVGQWAREVRGIGPVLAAGLLAHIDITRAPTVGHIWSFAGLNPTLEWKKGEKRPHNADLKTLCWKIGESFVKAGGEYGDHYRARKAIEIEKNGRGDFADQARAKLARFKIGKSTDAWKYYAGSYSGIVATDSGFKGVEGEPGIPMLPPAHINARAKRWAVKLFLSHLHDRWYRHEYGEAPPLPYPIAHLGHAHMIESQVR